MPKNLVTARLSVPGSWGLNTQKEADILPAQWATVADNCIFDDSGRLAARQGTQNAFATAITGSPDVKSAFEYIDGSGSRLTIFAAGNAIYKLVGSTVTDISGTITTPTADNWKFVNFNGKCVGFQAGHAPIVLSTIAGSFADITLSGTQQPTSAANEVLSAFGRLWTLDGSDLKYSDALDETSWNGVFDLSTVWLNGMDIGVAIAEFNGYLVIFGQQSVIVYSNPWSPTGGGGIDTSVMELVENIGGVGCIARDSVQYIGSDILFLSSQGVRSLGRTIQEKSMPINTVSKNVNDDLIHFVLNETYADIKSTYSKQEGFYALSLPTADKTYYFDIRAPLPDGTYKATLWQTSFSSMLNTLDNTLYVGTAGYLQTYTGYADDKASDGSGGTSYDVVFESGWNDLSEVNPQLAQLQKLPKTGSFLILGGAGQTASVKWAFDFVDDFSSFTVGIPAAGLFEWGSMEWGIGEWSGGVSYHKVRAPLRRTGKVIKIGFQITVNGAEFALQYLDLLLKVGRIAV